MTSVRIVAVAALGLILTGACVDRLPDQDLRIVSATPAAKLSTDVLWADYQADRNAADRKYWGKAIEITGKVTRSTEDPARIIFLSSPESQAGVEARLLDERAGETLAASPAGERVTLRCFCEGMQGNVILKSCIKP
jgi:hypothetical protein